MFLFKTLLKQRTKTALNENKALEFAPLVAYLLFELHDFFLRQQFTLQEYFHILTACLISFAYIHIFKQRSSLIKKHRA